MKALASIRRDIVIAILFVSVAISISVFLQRSTLFQKEQWSLSATNTDRSATAPSESLSPTVSPDVVERRAAIAERYAKLPIRFEANQGQTNHAVKFVTRGNNYSLFLTSNEAVWRLQKNEGEPESGTLADQRSRPDAQAVTSSVLRMRLVGANPEPQVSGVEPIQTKSNYFIGNDPRVWRQGVANFAKVKYESVYPGVDLVWYGNQQQLEHDFVVAPGADPRRIKLQFVGAGQQRLNGQGDLVLETDGGQMRLLKPVAWQHSDGRREWIACEYKLDQAGQVEFDLGRYDHDKPLVIDPILLYSTFVGGSGSDTGRGIAVDKEGNAYVVGETSSADFPVVNPIQPQLTSNFSSDVFVLKINPSGSALIYATYLGGASAEVAYSVAVGNDGAAYLTGHTFSNNFPTTTGALQPTARGGADAFVARITPAGAALSYSTYLGGTGSDLARGIAVNADDEAYITGYSDSINLPANGFQKTRSGNAFYKSLNRGGDWSASDNGLFSSLVYSLAVDPTNANVIYAGVSDGVYKTTDGGSNWKKSGDFFTVQSIAIDPKNSMTVFAATSFAFYKSTDGGATWQQKGTGIVNAFQFFSVVIDPITTATIYVGSDRGVFKSTNGGENFAIASTGMGQVFFPGQTPSIRVTGLVADPTNPMILYAGTNQGMFKTLDGGGLWFASNNGISSFSTILALAIDPMTPTTLYLSSNQSTFRGSLYKSTDGGNSWLLSSEGISIKFGNSDSVLTVYSLAVDPVTPGTIYAGTQFGGVFKSINGGASWSQSNPGLNNAYVRALAVANNPAAVYAGIFGGPDAFAAKLNAAGTALSYLTYLGGSEPDYGFGIAVDKDGNAFIAGQTDSVNFPTANALQSAKGFFGSDAFVTKINPTGTALIYSTYFGGSSADYAQAIAIDAAGSAYIAGATLSSSSLPTRNPLQATYAGGFYDAFVAKLNPAGSALEYSTFLGGNDQENATGIAVDSAGSAYVVGGTLSINFPMKDPVQERYGGGTDAYLAKLSPSGSTLVYSTYLGGFRGDIANAVAIDINGNAYVTGVTSSSDWPTVGPLQQLKGSSDLFIAKLGVEADLTITKTAARNPVMVGNNLTYTLNVTNAGLSPATGVVVSDPLPSGVTFGSATATQGSCSHNAGTVTCNLGNVPVKANAAITLTVTPTAAGAISNTARVQGNEPDNNPNNNQATARTTVSNLPSIAGRVTTTNGQGLAGVTVTLSVGQSSTRQTDSNGFYQFTDLTIGGAYTVTPSRDNYSFEPASRSFEDLNADRTADFAASGCSYSIAPVTQSFEASGGSGMLNVTATPRCPWTAVSNSDWIKITSGGSGLGNGTVNYTIEATTAPRSGRITVAGQNLAVYQGVASCGTPLFRNAQYYLGPTFASSGEGGPARMVVTDFNGDGKRDLVTLNILNRGFTAAESFRLLTVLVGDGQGGFASLLSLRLPGTVTTMAADDFNGDGRSDIVDLNGGAVEIRLNDGAGGLKPPRQFTFSPITQFGAPDTLTGDFNRDGKTDLLLFTNDSFNRQAVVRILLNDGTGGLKAPINVSLSDHITLGFADVNGDGNLDWLTYTQIPRGTTSIRELRLYPGDGAGSFSSPISSPVPNSPSNAAFGDFNGDGKTDVAVYLTSPTTSSTYGTVGVFAGDGNGRFTASSISNLPDDARNSLYTALAADLNGDGKMDLFTEVFGGMFLFPGDGTGKLGAPIKLLNNSTLDFAPADLDNDGKLDLAVISGVSGGNQAQVFFNRCGASPAIFGQVIEGGTSPFGVGGVNLKLSGQSNFSAQTQTDGGGNYILKTGLTLGANYTLTAERALYRFAPESKAISNLTSDQKVNFAATRTGVIVSAASFRGEVIAPESIAAIFGDGMTFDTLTANTTPLPTQLGSALATLKDSSGAERPVRLFFISPKQVNVLMPPGLAPGLATLTVTQFNSTGFPQMTVAAFRVENVAPGLFSLDGSGRGFAAAIVLRVKADGTQVYEPVATFDAVQQRFTPVPIDLSNPSEQVFLIPFATGIRNRSALSAVTAKIGGTDAEVSFAGGLEGLSGLDQINLRMSRSLIGRGDVEVVVTADGKTTNAVRVNVK
ncbi:MAG: SBBP repeat-containing protein [Blastocatellia bacterium]